MGRQSHLPMKKTLTFIDRFAELLDFRPDDTVIVISTSGRNPVPIDVALKAQQVRGIYGFNPVPLLQGVWADF